MYACARVRDWACRLRRAAATVRMQQQRLFVRIELNHTILCLLLLLLLFVELLSRVFNRIGFFSNDESATAKLPLFRSVVFADVGCSCFNNIEQIIWLDQFARITCVCSMFCMPLHAVCSMAGVPSDLRNVVFTVRSQNLFIAIEAWPRKNENGFAFHPMKEGKGPRV